MTTTLEYRQSDFQSESADEVRKVFKNDPYMSKFLQLPAEEQHRLMGEVSKWSADHAVFVIGPISPIAYDAPAAGYKSNRPVHSIRIGNNASLGRVEKAIGWWNFSPIDVKILHNVWCDDAMLAKKLHALVEVYLDGQGWSIRPDSPWHDIPLNTVTEAVAKIAKEYAIRIRTNEQRLDELARWAADEYRKANRRK